MTQLDVVYSVYCIRRYCIYMFNSTRKTAPTNIYGLTFSPVYTCVIVPIGLCGGSCGSCVWKLYGEAVWESCVGLLCGVTVWER